jgi:ABC-type ATPase involved in cell division
VTVVIASHDLDLVKTLGHRALTLKNGEFLKSEEEAAGP